MATTKIVGGTVAQDRPFMAGLVESGMDSIFCGGTFIAPDVVMTAAHCVVDGWDGLRVSGGTRFSDGLSTSVTAEATNVVVHEHYDADKSDNDIALIFLNKDDLGNFGGRVQTAVPSSDAALPEKAGTAIAVGWGVEHEGDWNLPHELREVSLPIIDQATCNSAGGDYASDVTAHQVCAGDFANGGIDTCQGDSGGPLLVQKNGKAEVIGITSWGEGCAEQGKPGVYTRVATYKPWIDGQLAKVAHQ